MEMLGCSYREFRCCYTSGTYPGRTLHPAYEHEWIVDLMWLDNDVLDASSSRSLGLETIRCADEIREQVRGGTELSVTDV